MYKQFIFFTIGLSLSLVSVSQGKYPVSSIPKALLENANTVKREEEIHILIKDVDKAIINTRYVITILNQAGDDAAAFVQGYSKLESLRSIDGNLYDANGKKIRSMKKSDVRDVSATDEGTLADDSRVKLHNFNYNIYPYTIEYESEVQLNGIFYLPYWMPISEEHSSVEKSALVVECPANYQLRYKAFNFANGPSVNTAGDTKTYQWKMENAVAIEDEKYRPSWHEVTASVFLAPTEFKIQDYSGKMTDWTDFGKFIYALNLGRDQLPDAVKQKVHQLTDGLPDARSKTKALYEFMQSSTHYISVQLGLGGWQTFDAKYVAANGYGDCKALSNYMYSLLKEAGIKSFYTLVKAGRGSVDFMEDFPSSQFNHIILCVPQARDTEWLECTSQTMPAGYLGDFTCNRPALLISELGGKLVHTPVYKFSDNTQMRRITGTVNDEGHLKANVSTLYRAEQQDDIQGMINSLSKEKILEYLREQIGLPSYNVENFSYKEIKSDIPSIDETLELTVNNFATKTGKRLFISPNLLNKGGAILNEPGKRQFGIRVITAYTDVDSVEINVPAGYKVESMPEAVKIKNKFGEYSSGIEFNSGKLLMVRKLFRNNGNYPSDDYKDMAKFLKEVYWADRSKVVLVKEN